MHVVIKNHFRVIFTCFLTFSFTCLGQTYLLAWFNQDIMDTLGISQTKLSIIYSLATFCASFSLPYFGQLVDRLRFQQFIWRVAVCLGLSFALLSQASGIVLLFLGYFCVRGIGQITIGLGALTTITKKFGQHRGKVLSWSLLGRNLGEMLWPMLMLYLLSVIGWRSTLLSFTGIIFCIFIPLVFWLSKDINDDPLYPENPNAVNKDDERVLTKKEFYSDKNAITILMASTLVPFVVTGIFFLQTTMAAEKGWELTTVGKAFTGYALIQVMASMTSGILVDKFSARKILGVSNIPLIAAFLTYLFFDGEMICYIFYSLLGLGIGLSMNVRNSFWAEAYGTKSLGLIKSIDSSYIVKATAISPILFSAILDYSNSVQILLYFLVATTIVSLILFLIAKHNFGKLHDTGKQSQ